MPSIEIYDHVFSSMGGYKTLYAHDGLSDEICNQLKQWAQLWIEISNKKTQWFSRPFHDYWLFGKVFPAGVDHAGRPRICVHSVLVHFDDIQATWRSFNPIEIPQKWFLGPGVNFSSLDKTLCSMTRDIPKSMPFAFSVDNLQLTPWQTDLVLSLFYSNEGIIYLGGQSEIPSQIVDLFKWMPFVYRKRWAYLPFPVVDSSMPLQIVMSKKPIRNVDLPPDIAEGFPPIISRKIKNVGLWCHLLSDFNGKQSRSLNDFYDWFFFQPLNMPIDKIPSIESENWLQVAYQCLKPLEDLKYNPQDSYQLPSRKWIAQLVLGVVSLGWAGYSGAAANAFGMMSDRILSEKERFSTDKEKAFSFIVESADLLWSSTVKIDNKVITGVGEKTSIISVPKIEENYSRVTLVLWQLLYQSPENIIKLARLKGVPPPDLRAGIVPWSKTERTLLWLAIAEFLNKMISDFTEDKDYYFGKNSSSKIVHSSIDSLLLGANITANLYKTKKLMAPDYQQQFSYFLNNRVTNEMRSLLDMAYSYETERKNMKRIVEVTQRFHKYTQ